MSFNEQRKPSLTESTCIYIYTSMSVQLVCTCVFAVYMLVFLWLFFSLRYTSLGFYPSHFLFHCQKSIHKTLVSSKSAGARCRGTANLWILMTSLNELYGPYFKKKKKKPKKNKGKRTYALTICYTHTHTYT